MTTSKQPAAVSGGGRSDDVDDDRSPVARLRRAQSRIDYLEGQVDALKEQAAALEAADEHRRAELAAAHGEVAEARAQAREAQARADERAHLIEELRRQLADAETGDDPGHEPDDDKRPRWRLRPSRSR